MKLKNGWNSLSASQKKILKLGVIFLGGMFILSILVLTFSEVAGTVLLLCTFTAVQLFTYAWWLETRTPMLHPVPLLISMLLTIALIILVLASSVIR